MVIAAVDGLGDTWNAGFRRDDAAFVVMFVADRDDESIDNDDAVIFGVSLAKQPTCYSTIDDDVGNDLIGYQGQTTITQVTPAKFELVMHTSSGSGSGSGSVQGPNQQSVELEKPSSFARVVSWASIIE